MLYPALLLRGSVVSQINPLTFFHLCLDFHSCLYARGLNNFARMSRLPYYTHLTGVTNRETAHYAASCIIISPLLLHFLQLLGVLNNKMNIRFVSGF